MAASVEELLRGRLTYDNPCQTFSPLYSRVGLCLGENLGVGTLVVSYNRKITLLTERFLEPLLDGRPLPVAAQENDPTGVLRTAERNGLWVRERATAVEADVYTYEVTVRNDGSKAKKPNLVLGGTIKTEPGFALRAVYEPRRRLLLITGALKSQDGRDPEPSFPAVVAIVAPRNTARVTCGQHTVAADEPLEATIEGDGQLAFELALPELAPGEAVSPRVAFALGLGSDDPQRRSLEAVACSAMSLKDAQGCTRAWLGGATKHLHLPKATEALQRLYAHCVHTLVGNTMEPHEGFVPYRAVFPNRGTYASHYLWDACFQSLGYARINTDVAAESLWLLAKRQEADGKIPQFSCATWNRPGASQPPLIAWAAVEIAPICQHSALYPQLYEPLCRWNRWWFTHRDADRDGLCEYSEALESGWDNSPRWDGGKVEPLDLNAFLVKQMACLSEIAAVLKQPDEEDRWERRSREHAQRIVDGLFHEDEGIFYDRLFESKAPVRVKTPAAFLPLWAGVPLPEAEARRSIERHLLSPETFFGPYPFPVVAYDEPTYEPGGWWRGPVWPNIAYLMTEVLRRYGYEKERREAVRRLVEMIVAGGAPHELYNSQTGEPLGAAELGWTAAVAILWIEDMLGW